MILERLFAEEAGSPVSSLEGDRLDAVIKEELVKHPELSVKEIQEIVDAAKVLVYARAYAAPAFGPSLSQLHLEYGLGIQEVVFVMLYAGANVVISNEMLASDPMKEGMSRRDFIRAASIAYDYMAQFNKQYRIDNGLSPKYEN